MKKARRILYVEDFIFNHDLFAKMIKRTTGFDYFHAFSIEEAFNLYLNLEKQGGISLLVTDISLPNTAEDLAKERTMMREQREFGRADYIDKIGGIKLISLIYDHIKKKSPLERRYLNFPVIYLSEWEKLQDYINQLIIYHVTYSYSWLEKPIDNDTFIDKCREMIECYDRISAPILNAQDG